jgi:hypothetical protein
MKIGIKGNKHAPLSLSLRNGLFITQTEAFAETLNTTGRVENALLTGKEWMAFGAHIDLQNRLGAHCLKTIPTSTDDCGVHKIWMDRLFHISAFLNI